MRLFKMKSEKVSSCSCGGKCNAKNVTNIQTEVINEASVKILGSGCKKCNQLEAATIAALKQLNMDTSIDHISDFTKIATYGVMSTPALVVDGKVVSYGKVLSINEIVNILQQVRG